MLSVLRAAIIHTDDNLCDLVAHSNNAYEMKLPLRDAVLTEVNIDGDVWLQDYFIHTHQRPEYDECFAFTTREDRDMFRRLIKIDKVGPAVALKILDYWTAQDIKEVTIEGFKRIKGVGANTAMAIFNELRGIKTPKPTKKKAIK